MQGPLIIIDLWTISPSNFDGVVSPSSKRGRLKGTRTKVARIDWNITTKIRPQIVGTRH